MSQKAGSGQARQDRPTKNIPSRTAADRKAPERNTPASKKSAPEDKRTKAERDADRRRRRALFLRELNEARELRARVQPRRARAARMRQALRMRTFRW